jgi:2-isopropylmalate synthase
MAYIEGGWPGSNPKDMEFFERAQTELDLQARLASLLSAPPARRTSTRRTTRRCSF